MEHATRLWMTGAAPVAIAAAFGGAPDDDEDDRGMVHRTTRHDVAETVRRIGDAAFERGLGVLALVDPQAFASTAVHHAAARVVVLAAAGGTPVLLTDGTPARLEAPFSVVVREVPGGGARVSFCGDADVAARCGTLPDDVAAALARLPEVVALALDG